MQSPNSITLRGVRVHNLKGIDIEIPLHRLTVVTGVSGAGKSSLVFDTLYAEAERRFLQIHSPSARQLLDRFDLPDADEISDLPAAVAIRRASGKINPGATVGSFTAISKHLRLLFAGMGTLYCPGCRIQVIAHHTADVVAALQAMRVGTRGTIAFSASRPDNIDQATWLASLLEDGYFRIQIGTTIHRLGEQTLPPISAHEKIWILLDRVEIGKTPAERLTESVNAAFRHGTGRLGVLTDTNERLFDQRFICSRCERIFPAPEPRLFDPSDSLGACADCQGIGTTGSNGDTCPTCQGRCWNTDALAVQINERTIADCHALPLAALLEFMHTLPTSIQVEQVRERLQAVVGLDLGFLTLQQPVASLSDGMARRIALAAALTSKLVHVLYLIDEPTTGLHPRDTDKLLDALHRLRDRGNTLVVIEHDRQVIQAADHVIDLGPGAGENGGQLMFQGSPAQLKSAASSPTSDFWTGRRFIEIPTVRRKPAGVLRLSGATTNHLQNLDVEFPLGVLCAITGVSGAGKSSLVEHTLYPALCLAKKKGDAGARKLAEIIGAEQINDVVLLDQTSLPRGSRSNPATYLKIFDEIRELFAAAVDAKARNFGPGHFSFNQPGGRCDTCEGQGSLTVDMQIVADMATTCPACNGTRYRKEILDVKVRNQSIADVLDLTIREAFRFFRAQPAIEKKLKVLLDVGLEYLRLGQSLESLAGNESQRLKLAGHLATSRKSGCLFLLTEPSAGLHPSDVANLLECFRRLLSAGHSLIVIEYDLNVIASADYVIDLGPEGGAAGGRIVAQGTPEEVAQVAESHTGKFLKVRLGRSGLS